MKLKEISKFLSGVAAWEAIAHIGLGASGNLPFDLKAFVVTPEINPFLIAAPAIISVLLAYYAWGVGGDK